MDLNALALFVEAANAGSLSEAARRTGVPLPTFSRRVRKLEEELSLRLLERGARGLRLTAAGSRLLADARPALASLSQAEDRLHDASGIAGTLRISVPPHFAPLWDLFEEFGQAHPAVRFDVLVADRHVDLVADGIDLVLRVGDGGHHSYVGRTLTRYRHLLVGAPELVQELALTDPDDLIDAPTACWRSNGPPQWQLGDQRVSPEPLLRTNDYEHLRQLAVAGRAITELPPFLAAGDLTEGRLVEVLPEYPMPLQSVRALVTETRALAPLIREFLDTLAERAPRAIDPASTG